MSGSPAYLLTAFDTFCIPERFSSNVKSSSSTPDVAAIAKLAVATALVAE